MMANGPINPRLIGGGDRPPFPVREIVTALAAAFVVTALMLLILVWLP